MILIVGLGNYGMEYNNTLHNCGFMAIDKFADENGIGLTKKRCKSLLFEGLIFGEKTILAKPLTYMNLSGEAVLDLVGAYKPEKMLIIYDDVDLPIGSMRFRNDGSAGTHNGMKNIVSLLGTTDIPRLRIGTKPNYEIFDLASYVLSKIKKDDKPQFESVMEEACKKVELFIKNKGVI